MKKLSTIEMRRSIARLNRLDPERADYEHIKRTYRSMFTGCSIPLENTKSTEMFFRTRVNPSSKPHKLEEIAAPPAKAIKGYQRCNPPGKPMFYTASKRLTSLLECNIKAGDIIYLSQWIGKQRLPVNLILDADKLEERSLIYSEQELAVHSYFDTLFTRRVHSQFSSDYKFTSAAAEFLTTNFPSGPDNLKNENTVGLRYPSVRDIQSSYNTVFHTVMSETMFEILHVLEARVLKIEDNDIELEVLDTAVNFADGDIHWLDDPIQLPIEMSDKSKILFISRDSKWTLPVRNRALTSDEMIKFLNE